ncbi:hypothetical protein EJ05DRAFT_482186 [Pseudovirgaria hyperparasitica]|uniref:Uncharacterized protein n=1 Tax=Pseudovirgaria hyperparasitica TaxID=470096 RepID=A0A6A6WMK5_9PEZI|nr:uncharacterized protein EJ05DRAFT_482186 [Pseudovirgaria hyperparasitica]KAF2763378.1 hypothetical protein EJ05DRAFT_482186 [Pseudovirgaria hyperparasitica]
MTFSDMAMDSSGRTPTSVTQREPRAMNYIQVSDKLLTFADDTDVSSILEELEAKRQQLDEQVVSFITDVQRSFDQFSENLLKQRLSAQQSCREVVVQPELDTTKLLASEEPQQEVRDVPHRAPVDTSQRRPGSSPVQHFHDRAIHDDRSPHDDREMELAGFFTPHFLPLLEATRSNSSPEVPTTKHIDEILKVNPSKLERSVSVPIANPLLTRKSALRNGRSSKNKRKRVSLSIDDSIVRPSDEPQNDTPVTPTDDDEGSAAPNMAITDKDGSSVYVWVPEKARLPLSDEDPIDYVIAVGGVLHEDASDLSFSTTILKDAPKTSSPVISPQHFDWSPITERKEFVSDADMYLVGPPKKSTFSPLPAPSSLAIRQVPAYTDSFSTSVNQVFSPVFATDPKYEVAGGLPKSSEGPPSSYVGGISGSGVDAMDTGSVGYPSSLGASYMEQFAAQRLSGSQNLSGIDRGDRDGTEKDKKKKRKVVKDARPEERIADSEEFLGEMEGI